MTENKNLSIVFITNNWIPFSAGVVSSITAFRQELMRQGHHVTVVTLDFKRSLHEPEDGVIRVYCPIKFSYKGIPLAVPLRADKQVRDIINKLQPDIIHSHHPFLLGISALKAAKTEKIPCIFTYHSLYEKYTHYIPMPQQLLKKLVRFRVKKYCKQVDGIMLPGKETKRLLIRDDITTPHIVLPSPLQEVYMRKRVQSVQRIHRAATQPFRLMTCSRFVKEKNIPFLLECFARLDQTKFSFTLAGFGNELEALQTCAYQTFKLSPTTVKFAIKLPLEDLCALYAAHDLFIFSSLAETQGLVLAEAMVNGLPVVALNGPGQEDIIIHGENGFLVHNQKEMQQAIEHLAGDGDLHYRLRCNALETAKRYTPGFLTEQLVDFYRRFLPASSE
ncbi:MAG: glycosyltransferase [Candidatus Babeliales bacterium]